LNDQRPPRLVGEERETLHALMQYQRESVVRKVDGLDEESARRRLVGSDTTLLWLVKHLAYAESLWIHHRFAGEDVAVTDDSLQPGDDPPVNLRWVLTHLLEETARHTGHADILRELIDGDTGR
jgi:uncharacterized damage-inducible protein DinB